MPFAVLVSLSVLGFGLVNKLVDGNVGLTLSLVCLFFNGGGVSGRALHIGYYRRLINVFTLSKYDFRNLCRVSGRRHAASNFGNLGGN